MLLALVGLVPLEQAPEGTKQSIISALDRGKVMAKKPKEEDMGQVPLLPSEAPAPGHSNIKGEAPRQKFSKTIRLAVSGDIFLTKLETAIIDTPDFQRLRRIRQLGTTFLVYPTAIHTRFDHSLGTLAMASRLLQAIKANTHSSQEEREFTLEQEVLARLYALLHDLTHIPFGHTLEDELEILQRHDKNNARIERFVGKDSPIGTIIRREAGEELFERFYRIYRWDEKNPEVGDDAFVYDLVSNTVCADLLDYIARDCFFCGIDGATDTRFVNFLYLMKQDGLRRVFVRLWKPGKPVPRRDTLSDLAGLLHSRYLLAERVYFHHAKINSGAMLGRALQEAKIAGKIDETILWGHGDDSLLTALASMQGTLAADLAKRILDRQLYKQIVRYTKHDFMSAQEHDHETSVIEGCEQRLKNADFRRSLENSLADQVGAREGDVLIYSPGRKMNLKAAGMRVLWKGEAKKLQDIDDPIIKPRLDLTLKAHEELWGVSVIGNPELSERQRSLLREASYLELCCAKSEAQERRLAYYEKLVDDYLLKAVPQPTMSAATMLAGREEAAQRLIVAANDSRKWQLRVKEAVESVFELRKKPEKPQ